MSEQSEGLKGPIELPMVGGPLDGQTRHFDNKAPDIYDEAGARYRLDHYMHDYRYQGDAEPVASSGAVLTEPELQPEPVPTEPEVVPTL